MMFKMIFLALSFIYCLSLSSAQLIIPGKCDANIKTVANFNASDFAGTWYEVEAYPKEQQPGQCILHEFTVTSGNFNIITTGVSDQFLGVTNSVASLDSDDGNARMTITTRSGSTDITIPYWILATDYTNYALAYSCINDGNDFQMIWSWKLSRTKQLTPASVTAINTVVNTIPVLKENYYTGTDQSAQGCFYYPEPEPRIPVLPVVFPGQCDQNIQAVPNFNLNSFAGTWYEIQAYPMEQQTGQCVSHAFTAGSTNTLNLVSSSVSAQNLSTTNSVVRFDSPQDSSGKLVISLTGTDINIPFWVLETNYNDFALAYSCVNINETFKSVYSWKLSRTRTLSQAANTIINDRIDQIYVLNNRYYEYIDQSDDACYHT